MGAPPVGGATCRVSVSEPPLRSDSIEWAAIMKLGCRSGVLLLILAAVSFCQGGGRGVAPAIDSIPNLTSGQRSLLVRADEDLSSPARAVAAARSALTAAEFAEPPNPNAIRVMAGAVREAELEFASS